MSTPASLLQNIEDALSPIIAAAGGEYHAASTLEHALEILSTSPKKWRVIATFEGYGDHPGAKNGINEARFLFIVHAATGLRAKPGANVHRVSPSERLAFLDLLETVSGNLRALRWPDGFGVDCAGLVLSDSNWITDAPGKSIAHQMTFSLTMALPPLPPVIVVPVP